MSWCTPHGRFPLALLFATALGCSSETSADGASSNGGSAAAGRQSPGGASSGGGGASGAAGAVASAGGTSAGGTSTSGAGGTNTGGGAGASGGNGGGAPHTVLACDELSNTGQWEDILPSGINLDPDFATPAGSNFGVHGLVLDPRNSGTAYVGSSAQGIYKTTDCGSTWIHVNTGTNGALLDSGRQWTFVVDHVNPDVLYTNAGYGQNNAFKSTNAGVDWDFLIDSESVKALQFGGFVHLINMDPTDHEHLIVTPHFACETGAVDGKPLTAQCLLETTDAGATWKIVEGTPVGQEGSGQWMVDATTWYWTSSYNGLYRTTNAGVSWEHVYSGGYANIGDFRLGDGTRLLGGVFNVLQSTDDGATWSVVPGAPGIDIITGDETTLYGVRGPAYHQASAADPATWTDLPTPNFPRPDYVLTWDFKYDVDHHVLYSANSNNGLWRLVVP